MKLLAEMVARFRQGLRGQMLNSSPHRTGWFNHIIGANAMPSTSIGDPARQLLAQPGSDRFSGHCGQWRVAWESVAGPHHANQDYAGAALLTDLQAGHSTPQTIPVMAAAVADGVTHGAHGRVAAQALVHHWIGKAPEVNHRVDFLSEAEPAVVTALQQISNDLGAATGAACWLRPDGSGWVTRVGDCRLLLARHHNQSEDWEVRPLMLDQTYALVYAGLIPGASSSEAKFDDTAAAQPACMVGCGSMGKPEFAEVRVAADEVLLLLSDGAHAYLKPEDWQAVFKTHLGETRGPPDPDGKRLSGLVTDLIKLAQATGSEDDISVMAISHFLTNSNSPRASSA